MRLSEDDLRSASVIQQLARTGILDIAALQACHGIEPGTYFQRSPDPLHPLAFDGLVTYSQERIAFTARGQSLLRNQAICFDAHAMNWKRVTRAPSDVAISDPCRRNRSRRVLGGPARFERRRGRRR